jgi:hypothetical protein
LLNDYTAWPCILALCGDRIARNRAEEQWGDTLFVSERRRSRRHQKRDQLSAPAERPLIEARRWIEAQTAFWSGSLDSLAGYSSEEQ